MNIGILCIRAASCKTQQEKITKQDKITQQENTFLGIKCGFLLSYISCWVIFSCWLLHEAALVPI